MTSAITKKDKRQVNLKFRKGLYQKQKRQDWAYHDAPSAITQYGSTGDCHWCSSIITLHKESFHLQFQFIKVEQVTACSVSK